MLHPTREVTTAQPGFIFQAWNSLRDEGAAMLASALYLDGNQTLRSVDVSNNAIGERGAMALADMCKENRGLRSLVVSANPIGRRGARAM